MSKLSEDDRFWLSTYFQNTIENSLQLSKAPAPEQTPYVHKYVAIKSLKKLLQDQRVQHFKFIPHTLLGQLYSDVQQGSDSIRSYESSIRCLSELPHQQLSNFLIYLLIAYNMLGLSYMNRDQNEQGVGCLAKAHDIYEQFLEYKGVDIYNNRSQQLLQGRHFQCFYEGGIDHKQFQDQFTLTLFYLAQGYTKLGFKQKAAQHCGRTLQRQYQTNSYVLNEFCHNLIGLSQYYRGNKFYGQGQYLLMLALRCLPQGKKMKMRAVVQIALGDLLGDILKYASHRIANNNPPTQEDNRIINRELLLFNNFEQKFPKLELPKDIQGCKSIFRQANTQYKKALQVYVLDGFVTQHIDTLFSQSKLYKYLGRLQVSKQRLFSMYDKRRELLEPLLKQLNPKAYPATWQKVLVQVSSILTELFNLKHTIILQSGQNPPPQQKLKQLNLIGSNCNHYYQQIVKALKQDKDAQKNDQYYRSILNSNFNIAKTYSRMLSEDKKVRVQFLKESLKRYQAVLDFIKGTPKPEIFEKEMEMTHDIILMMPTRIDRINYGQVSPVDLNY